MLKTWNTVRDAFWSMKMKKKLCLIFTLTSISVLLLIFAVYNHIYRQETTKNTTAVFEQTAQIYCAELDNLLQTVSAIAGAPYYSEELQRELKIGKLSSNSQDLMNYAVYSGGSGRNTYYRTTLVYNVAGSIVFSHTRMKDSKIKYFGYDYWDRLLEPGDPKTHLITIRQEDGDSICVVIKRLRMLQNYEDIGITLISIPKISFDKLGGVVLENSMANIVLFDENQEVFYNSLQEDRTPQEMLTAMDSMPDAGMLETDAYLGYRIRNSSGRYTVLIYISKALLFSELRHTQAILLAALIVSTAFLILLVLLAAETIVKPLNKITILMNAVQSGDWTVRFHNLYRDEIGVLGSTFNLMLDNMSTLKDRAVKAEATWRQTEIDALKQQINPHFMYNMMQTFQMMAVENNDFELAQLISDFGKVMRYNITTMNEESTLEQEVKYLQLYLTVQNSRREKEVILRTDIPGELLQYSIIKLLLQPIVENAVIHGFQGSEPGEKVIRLTARTEGKNCVIEVEDNGSGMTEKQIEELQSALQSGYLDTQEGSHVGMRNVNERIRLYYGETYGISVSSVPGAGTKVRVILPGQGE